jgi:hypothetical protein
MLPLTDAEMKKYLAELEKNKNPDGYTYPAVQAAFL